MNTVCLTGRLVRDPELRYTPSGNPVCTFSIATTDRKKDGDNWVDDPTFVDMTAWGKRAETLSQYKRKGDTIIIAGRIKQERWTDKDSGKQRSKLVVSPERIEWPGSNETRTRQSQETNHQSAPAAASNPVADVNEDDVPF